MRVPLMRETFIASFTAALATSAQDPEVAGFKSVVCYRTGLDVSLTQESSDMDVALVTLALRYESLKKLRLESKPLNDFVVVTTLRIAAQYGKPGACSDRSCDGRLNTVGSQCNSTPAWATTTSPSPSRRRRSCSR